MAPLATLPLFLKLRGRRVVLAGGGDAAVWKAELLAAAGADVAVFAAEPVDAMTTLAADPPAGSIAIHHRTWRPEDLTDAAFAIGAIEDDEEGLAFRDAAKAAGVLVNVVDKPALCDVQFGGIVNRSPLVIGISTDGAAPVFGQAVRAKIEAILPQGFTRWAIAAKSWREKVQSRHLPFQARRRFWELFSAQALASPEAEPKEALVDDLIREADKVAHEGAGRVILVGAGPGDPELLTLKAVRALQSADVIVHDDLVPAAILDTARREAIRIAAGKRGRGPSCKQVDINELIVTLASQGKRVVRLKSGDPMIFGRAGEEIAAARAAGIPIEVVPGITAAQGAAAALGVSLTHRDHARRVQYVTAHGKDGRLPRDLSWDALADPAASTVVYMPGGTWHEMAAGLALRGVRGDMPAIAVANATRKDQDVILATVATLGERLAAASFDGPVLVLFGEAFGEIAPMAVLAGANRLQHGATPALHP
ncbi:uroporphyrinogen-III C-methyltransferase [Phreatobacter aquaticus]|uniref:Uroporphyrinogen-III C-methyltransferase n=1 Tax=Phreatobacter aquaticus TaxID=2570229 RepID=A0A4D7QLG6_9HYPH|nr:siroheme synthase CysG [Phreatobacter aquaticus]QCK87401.1 uroporphyrinogen-III C-methyltransferase [Phreatobacter aquaticus]